MLTAQHGKQRRPGHAAGAVRGAGGPQSLHTNSRDEAAEPAYRRGGADPLRTQQIIGSKWCGRLDRSPAGSYLIESWTTRLNSGRLTTSRGSMYSVEALRAIETGLCAAASPGKRLPVAEGRGPEKTTCSRGDGFEVVRSQAKAPAGVDPTVGEQQVARLGALRGRRAVPRH